MRNRNQLPFPTLSGPVDPRLSPNNYPPLSGYSIYSDNEMANSSLGQTVQAFTSLSDSVFPSDNTMYKELGFPGNLNSKSEILWLITVSAMQTTPRLEREPVSYSTAAQIQSSQNLNPPRYSIFQAKASWSDGSPNQNVVYFDIAGTSSLLVMARSVTVNILAPNPTYWIENQIDAQYNTRIPQLSGLVINAILSARIAPQPVPRTGCDILKFTKRITTVDDEGAPLPGFVEIPPAARKVQIFNCLDSVTSSNMYFWIGNDSTVGYNQGIINFNGDVTGEIFIPSFATHIYTGPTNASNFTFVFLIDP